ncbi:MAG: hypothetical protein V1859_10640 [archaeon]
MGLKTIIIKQAKINMTTNSSSLSLYPELKYLDEVTQSLVFTLFGNEPSNFILSNDQIEVNQTGLHPVSINIPAAYKPDIDKPDRSLAYFADYLYSFKPQQCSLPKILWHNLLRVPGDATRKTLETFTSCLERSVLISRYYNQVCTRETGCSAYVIMFPSGPTEKYNPFGHFGVAIIRDSEGETALGVNKLESIILPTGDGIIQFNDALEPKDYLNTIRTKYANDRKNKNRFTLLLQSAFRIVAPDVWLKGAGRKEQWTQNYEKAIQSHYRINNILQGIGWIYRHI